MRNARPSGLTYPKPLSAGHWKTERDVAVGRASVLGRLGELKPRESLGAEMLRLGKLVPSDGVFVLCIVMLEMLKPGVEMESEKLGSESEMEVLESDTENDVRPVSIDIEGVEISGVPTDMFGTEGVKDGRSVLGDVSPVSIDGKDADSEGS